MDNPDLRPGLAKLRSLKDMHATRLLKLSDLVPGDLLFAISATSGEAVHVTIVTRRMDGGAVRQVHQVEDKKFSGLHENDVVPEGILVLRCRKEGLGKRAAELAGRWSDVPAPYSSLRAAIAKGHEASHGKGDELIQVHRRLFNESAKFRAIKYAARRDGALVAVSERESIAGNKGMFCSMFVCICYQVAGLEHVVRAGDPRQLVSDKRMLEKELTTYRKQFEGAGHDELANLQQYEQYLRHLHEFSPYGLDTDSARFKGKHQTRPRAFKIFPTKFIPSLAFWCGGRIDQFNFADCITAGMMLDAKVIYPAGLLACLRNDTAGWEECGFLTGNRAFSESPAEKADRMEARQRQIDQTYFKRK